LQITQLPTRSVIISKSYYSFSPQLIYLKRSLFMNPQSTIFGTKRGLDFTAPLHERGKLFLHTVEHMYTNQNIHSSIPIQFKLHIIILNPTGNMVSITHDRSDYNRIISDLGFVGEGVINPMLSIQ